MQGDGLSSPAWRRLGELVAMAATRRVSELEVFLDGVALVSDVDGQAGARRADGECVPAGAG